MKGLILKDILNLRKQFKTTLLVIGFFAIYAYGTNNPSYMLAMVTLIFAMMPITAMGFDDMSKWDRYALAMPISRKSIVMSKYILSVCLSLLSILVSFFITYIVILPRTDMTGNELLLIAYIIFSISLVFIAIVLPFIYKYGVERARIISIGIFALPTMIVLALYKIGFKLPSKDQLMLLLKISPILLSIIVITSASVSYRIFKSKDI
ncbi:MAG: ABC-2 transporter permease [Gudongella sp.]|nr:ABC-2 transporter permease [Gudongella sp.]